MALGVYGNTAYPVGDGGFEAFVTVPRQANFFGQSGWWTVPQQWYSVVDRRGQIFVSPNPFPATPTSPAPVISGSATVHFVPGPPVTNVTFNGSGPHGLNVGDRVTISGAADAFLNGAFVVTNVLSATAFNYQVTNLGGGTYSDPCTAQGPDIVNPQPSPKYAAKVNQDGGLVFQDAMRNLRSGNSNPYNRR